MSSTEFFAEPVRGRISMYACNIRSNPNVDKRHELVTWMFDQRHRFDDPQLANLFFQFSSPRSSSCLEKSVTSQQIASVAVRMGQKAQSLGTEIHQGNIEQTPTSPATPILPTPHGRMNDLSTRSATHGLLVHFCPSGIELLHRGRELFSCDTSPSRSDPRPG